jgi:hypothetical protein
MHTILRVQVNQYNVLYGHTCYWDRQKSRADMTASDRNNARPVCLSNGMHKGPPQHSRLHVKYRSQAKTLQNHMALSVTGVICTGPGYSASSPTPWLQARCPHSTGSPSPVGYHLGTFHNSFGCKTTYAVHFCT